MEPRNADASAEATVLLNHAKTLRLHTGNLVNRSRLKKKCPGSPGEELQDCIQATLSDWFSTTKPPSEDLPDTLDCSVSQATDAITPEEREEVKVSVKLFLCESLQSSIRDAVEMACQTLAVSQLDSVIIAPPGLLEGDSQTLAHLQPAWEELETLVRSQRIAAIGTSDLDKDLLEQLYNWAQVKPSSNQVNLASCCVMPPDLTTFAKEFDIQLLTHNDPKEKKTPSVSFLTCFLLGRMCPSSELMSAATFQEAVQGGTQDLNITDWRLEWVLRYSVIVKSRGIIKSKGYLVVEDGGEEDEEELSGGEEADLRSSSGRGSLLTRRGITLRVLLKDGLVEPGDGVLAIHYLGKNFIGDLLNDGKIRWVETGQIFNSPSAWATHCKRLVNPAKKSGCGWASVRYRGQKLVQYKTTWLHKYQPSADMDDDEDEEEGKTAVQADEKNKNAKPGLNDVMVSRRTDRERIPVRYCTLGTRDAARDPHTLVELSAFSAINRFQPFNVAVSSNVLLLMICQNLFMRGLSLVGWYHSHPRGPALPSLQDIDSQMDHQLRLQGSNNGFQPCLGIICGPYYHGNQGVASTITPFWVVPPPEVQTKQNSNYKPSVFISSKFSYLLRSSPQQRPNDHGIPVAVEVTYVQDNFLTSDVLNEMVLTMQLQTCENTEEKSRCV
ncbi:hypothetical protein F2P81_005773 [Scophthalmus maximus]|uniref:GCS light chain n=1 Tax=Scophthalmus maximus TaxID=52904 RepID=A0A6A4THC9_SCOMX|nr:hypothetical protein F2P81_005773 [Scophthalmus maximus]